MRRKPDQLNYFRHIAGVIGLITLMFTGCLEPDTENIWTMDHEVTLETIGFSRDILIHDTIAFVGSGEAGIEIWRLGSIAGGSGQPQRIFRIDSLSPTTQFSDINRLQYSPMNQRLFAIEFGSKVFPLTLADLDTFAADNPTMSTLTRDFLVLDATTPGIPDSTYIIIAADGDDGLKIQSYKYTVLLGVPGWNESGLISEELSTDGEPTGVDYDAGWIALSTGETGVKFYEMSGDFSVVTERWSLDTPYNAQSVTLQYPYAYIADDDGGLIIAEIDSTGAYILSEIAQDLNAVHVTVQYPQAAISLESRGVALIDVSDPVQPASRGIHDIGYTYRTVFAYNRLFATTRQGVKIYRID